MLSCNCLKVGIWLEGVKSESSLTLNDSDVDPVTRLICEDLRTKCSFIPYYGQVGDVTQQTGFFWELMNGTFNMTDQFFVPTVERKEHLSMPNYMFSENLDGIFITRRSTGHHYSATSFLGPFQTSTWLMTVFSIFTVSFVVEFGNGGTLKGAVTRYFCTCVDLLVYLARKGPRILTNSTTSKMILIVWGLAALYLIMAFSSGLLSSLLSGKKNLPFSNFETLTECVEEDRCSFLFGENNWFYTTSKQQHNPSFARFWKAVSKHVIQIEPTFDSALETVRSRLDKFHVIGPFSSSYLSEILGDKCDLLLVKTDITTHSTIFLRKGDPFVNKLNDVLLKLDESGLFEAVNRRRYQLDPSCDWFGVTPDTHKGAPMPLTVMLGPVVLLLIGFLTALLSLFAERMTFGSNCV